MIIGLIVSETNKPSERFLETDIEIYRSLGHQVKVFANDPQSDTPYKAITKLSIKFLFIFFRMVIFKPQIIYRHLLLETKRNSILEAIKNTVKNLHILSENVDILIYAFGSLLMGKRYLAKAINIPAIISLRGADVGILPLSQPNFYYGISKNTSFHFVSEHLKKDFLNLYPEYVGYNSFIIEGAIDTAFFCKEKTAKNNNFLEICTIARFHWKKNLPLLINAIAELKKTSTKKIRLTIIGNGDKEEALFLKKQLKLTDSIRILENASKKQIKEELNQCDVYVQPSLQEGFCTALMEAMSCECLVISSNWNGVHQLITNKENGFILNKNSPHNLAKMILDISSYPEIRMKARNKILTNYSIEITKSKWNDILQEKFIK